MLLMVGCRQGDFDLNGRDAEVDSGDDAGPHTPGLGDGGMSGSSERCANCDALCLVDTCEDAKERGWDEPCGADGVVGHCVECSPTKFGAASDYCGDENPYCGEDYRCRECLSNAHCHFRRGLGLTAPRCDADSGRCEGCRDDSDCPDGEYPYCAANGSCVSCRNDDDCGHRYCDAEGACSIECRTNADCGEREPHCGDDGQCSECEGDAECAPHGKLCLDLGEWSSCEDCRPGDPASCANGLACVREFSGRYTCSGAKRGTLALCEQCQNDLECGAGYACVSQEFHGQSTVRYCTLKAPSSGACPKTVPVKRKAIFEPIDNHWTLSKFAGSSGDEADFCMPDGDVGSCSGLNTFGDACNAEEEASGTCGSWVVDGYRAGICVGNGGEKRCTYECKTNADCRSTCVGISPSYCNPF